MPKSSVDWLAMVCAWAGSIILAISSWNAPLWHGAPTILTARFWHFAPAVLVSIALAILLFRQLRSLSLATTRPFEPTSYAPSVSRAAEPGAVPPLSQAERERAAEALRDVLDYITDDVRPLYIRVAKASSGSAEDAVAALQRIGAGKVAAIMAKGYALQRRYSLYLGLIQVDIMPLVTRVLAVEHGMENALRAKDWPAAAQADKVREMDELVRDLGEAIDQLKAAIPSARREFIAAR